MNTRLSRARTGVLAVGAALTLGLAGCSSGTPSSTGGGSGGDAPTDGTLTVGLLGDIGQPPDPDIYYANNGTAIMINAYEGLVQYKNNTDKVEIAPRLAESWEVNPTHDVYTFHLRQGVKFHDGTPFTSAAVDVAFKRRIAVKGGAAYMVEAVKSVATPDDHTAVITLNQPNTAFLSYLASPFGPKMESPDGLKANAGSDDAQTYLSAHDLGTGPYMLTTAQTGVKYELTQFDGYWGPKSPFKKVELPVYTDESALELAFDNGTVDTIVAALPSSSLDKYAIQGRRVELLPADAAGRDGDGELQPRLLQDTRGPGRVPQVDRPGDVGETGAGQAIRGGHHHVRQGHGPGRGPISRPSRSTRAP